MLSTVPFVVYGILRLQYSIFQKERWSQSLEELVLHDTSLVVSMVLYFLLVLFLMY